MVWSTTAFGADVIEVVKQSSAKLPIDLSGLRTGNGEAERSFRKTLERDLTLSGWFDVGGARGGGVAVSGACDDTGGALRAGVSVVNTVTGRAYLTKNFARGSAEARRLAHEVNDEIVWAVKKVKGIASTRIAMIGKAGKQDDLYICDADGGGLVRLTRDGAICLRPRWTPGGQGIFYTSFVGGYPDVYRIDLKSNRRERVVSFPGLNTGAIVSPDGRRLALVLSKDGNPDLYVIDLADRRLTRLTRTGRAAEASPTWSPDGNQLAFVSNSSGLPQIYVLGASGGEPKRVTFRGSENVCPDYGPDGRIVYSSKREGVYQIYVYDPQTGEHSQLKQDYANHEDPSWARDGRHVVCSVSRQYRRSVYILDTLGDPPVRLAPDDGEWYAPDWSRE